MKHVQVYLGDCQRTRYVGQDIHSPLETFLQGINQSRNQPSNQQISPLINESDQKIEKVSTQMNNRQVSQTKTLESSTNQSQTLPGTRIFTYMDPLFSTTPTDRSTYQSQTDGEKLHQYSPEKTSISQNITATISYPRLRLRGAVHLWLLLGRLVFAESRCSPPHRRSESARGERRGTTTRGPGKTHGIVVGSLGP